MINADDSHYVCVIEKEWLGMSGRPSTTVIYKLMTSLKYSMCVREHVCACVVMHNL